MNRYEEAHRRRMTKVPHDVDRFCDARAPPGRRRELLRWIRDLDDPTCPQMLQIRFAMSVPNDAALRAVGDVARGRALVSIASGLGYWESLLAERRVDVHAFDIRADDAMYRDMAHLRPQHGEPAVLAEPRFRDAVLFLAWPDSDGARFDHSLARGSRGSTAPQSTAPSRTTACACSAGLRSCTSASCLARRRARTRSACRPTTPSSSSAAHQAVPARAPRRAAALARPP
eukprot:Unigene16462_Nuclearia_a/m.48741 Unigene16462_Nuclearia_a/g.48741  ORF Unigene16462_Nuclearia_a/g.48741 Unigene16462_Nuclearia_a/m.48741 type:complete len:230 (-) Unigene16462_Nuclearia_a:122-811(-)